MKDRKVLEQIFEEEVTNLGLRDKEINLIINDKLDRKEFIKNYLEEKGYSSKNPKFKGVMGKIRKFRLMPKVITEVTQEIMKRGYISYATKDFFFGGYLIKIAHNGNQNEFRKTCRHELYHIAAGHLENVKRYSLLRNLILDIPAVIYQNKIK